MSEPRCALGNHPVPPGDRHYVEVAGWEKPGRGAGGQSGSSLVLRTPTGRVACSACITRARHHLHPGQDSLL